MKVFLDTNIILDRLLRRGLSIDIVDEIFNMIYSEMITGFTTANALTDIFYIASKIFGKDATKYELLDIINILSIISVDHNDCLTTLNLPITDFEDAIAVVCATKADVEYIITNDIDFPKDKFGKCKVVKPEEFIKLTTPSQ